MKKQEKEILEFIKVLRKSFSDADIVYKFGACYWLFEILKYLYPESVWYMVDDNHVVTRIWDKYYDISWEYIQENNEELKEFTYETDYIAGSWRDWQRLERMLKKYSDLN